MKKVRKPRDIDCGFWDGFAQWCDWEENTTLNVNLKLGCATSSELRRMANWMLRAANYIDYKKSETRSKHVRGEKK